MNAVAGQAPYRPRRRERCESCGAPGRFGQLICLGCGERMALEPRGGPSRTPFLVVAALMVATGAVALLMVVEGIGTREGTLSASETQTPTAAESPSLDRAAAQSGKRRTEERARRAILAAAGGAWPAGQAGYTVVLANTGDLASAESFASTVSNAGDDAGVIVSEDHPNLGAGLFVVFAGVYSTEQEAGMAAARLGESYSGAYTQYVEAPKKR